MQDYNIASKMLSGKWYPNYFINSGYGVYSLIIDEQVTKSLEQIDNPKWRTSYEIPFLQKKLGDYFDTSKWFSEFLTQLSRKCGDHYIDVIQADFMELYGREMIYPFADSYQIQTLTRSIPVNVDGLFMKGSSELWGLYTGDEHYQWVGEEFNLFVIVEQHKIYFESLLQEFTNNQTEIKSCDASTYFKIAPGEKSIFEIHIK